MVGAQATAANLATPRLVEGIQDRGHKLSILTTDFLTLKRDSVVLPSPQGPE